MRYTQKTKKKSAIMCKIRTKNEDLYLKRGKEREF